MHLLLKWLVHFYKCLCSLDTRLRERVKSAALIVLSYFWHSNQLCKLEKKIITLHPHFHARISHVRSPRSADARRLYSPVSFWPPHTLPFTFYGLHAEPNLESNGNLSSVWSCFMPDFPCKLPCFAAKAPANRTTCEIQDYYSEIIRCFEKNLLKTKDLSSAPLLNIIAARAAAR